MQKLEEFHIDSLDLTHELREPLKAHWQNQYAGDQARFLLLKQELVTCQQKNGGILAEEDALNWIPQYFHGCCPKDISMPSDQDPKAILNEIKDDIHLVGELGLKSQELDETKQMLKCSFIGGYYPIILGKNDEKSKEALLEKLRRVAIHSDDEQDPGIASKAQEIVMNMEEYRKCLAQDLDFEYENMKRSEEIITQHEIFERKFERILRDFSEEETFLSTLTLPEYEAQDWQDHLERIAQRGILNPNPKYRERVHSYVRWLTANMSSKENDETLDDPWFAVSSLIKNYWTGDHHQDDVRWMILQREIAKLPKGLSESPTGDITSRYILHEKFVNGCHSEVSKMNATQNPDMIRLAYENDIQLMKSLPLSDTNKREAKWEYNEYLLEGKLPLAADREMPQDRVELEEKLRRISHNKYWSSTALLQAFCDHWYPISRRPAPRRKE
jgi:hypothetical protein